MYFRVTWTTGKECTYIHYSLYILYIIIHSHFDLFFIFYPLSASKYAINGLFEKGLHCWPLRSHSHFSNTVLLYLTFPFAGMKIINMTSKDSGRRSQFLLKQPPCQTRIKTAGWFGCHSRAVILSSPKGHISH